MDYSNTVMGDDYTGYSRIMSRRSKITRSKVNGEYQYMADAMLNICPYCNKKMSGYVIDHIYPVAKGGNDSHDNLTPCCKKCNNQKKDLSLLVFLATRTNSNIDKYWKSTGNWHGK